LIPHRDEERAKVYMHRGNLFRRMKERDKALHDYAQAVSLDPDSGRVYVNRGWLFEQQGRLDLARADYEKAATLVRNDEWLNDALRRTRN
jgi:Tfp pilus assembly protein PilF